MRDDTAAIPPERRLVDRAFAAVNTSPYRLLVVAVGTLGLVAAALGIWSGETLILVGCAIGIAVLVGAYRLDYMHPAVAFGLPWLVVLFLSTIPISTYSRPLGLYTSQFLLAAMFAWLVSTVGPPVLARKADTALRQTAAASDAVTEGSGGSVGIGVAVLFLIFYATAAFNAIYAGYVPLISLLTIGNSRYFTFGIHSVYGAFLAYANTIGCLAFYLYLRDRRKGYLWLFVSVLCVHILFVTRQNILTLLVEALVIRCLMVRKFSKTAVILFIVLGLGAFSGLGNLRTGGGIGKIQNVIGVRQQYSSLPSGVIWVYAYSYFNVLNLENMMTSSGAPLYDGSMWDGLLPSVLRPEVHHETFLELSSMSVSSYIYPVYLDIGPAGVLIWTAFWGLVTAYYYRNALGRRRFVDVGTYACLYYCALFSFFVNFWLVLPVIFQVVFFRVIHNLLFANGRGRATLSSCQPA